MVDGVAVADSTDSVYLFELGHLPVHYVPKADVRFDLLEYTDHSSHCPRKGDAEYWSIIVGDRRIDNAVWGYPVPLDGAPDLSDYVAFYWNKVDSWFEDDERILSRPTRSGVARPRWRVRRTGTSGTEYTRPVG